MGMFDRSLNILGSRAKIKVYANLLENPAAIRKVSTKYGDIRFFCLGNLALWRAETFFSKEPEILAWIDSFAPDDVLWDIGANMGCYALYAARKGTRVFAFEPSSANYYLLNKNIEINQLEDLATAHCIAFSDRTEVGALNMSSTMPGGAVSTFGLPAAAVACGDYTSAIQFRQGMVGYRVDDFVSTFNFVKPNHLKIDVDGLEDKIIEGALKTLRDQSVKSLYIELDISQEEYCRRVTDHLAECGFELVTRAHAPLFEGGLYANLYNHIFQRK